MSLPLWVSFIWYFCFILGSFVLTILTDAAREPLTSKTVFWKHWWHTPLLVYTNIASYWPISLLLYRGGTIYHIILTNGIAAIITFSLTCVIWLHYTRTPQVSPPKYYRSIRMVNILLLLGAVISFSGLFTFTLYFLGFSFILSRLPITFLLVMFYAMIVGLAVYIIGFVFRLYVQRTRK